MSLLKETLVALPDDALEDMVLTHFGNMIFGLATADSREEELENLEKVKALRNDPIVQALSETAKADMYRLLDSAASLLEIDDNDPNADDRID
jgi:hypothetical protein